MKKVRLNVSLLVFTFIMFSASITFASTDYKEFKESPNNEQNKVWTILFSNVSVKYSTPSNNCRVL